MKLYFAPRTRSTRALWMLEEVGEPFELVRLNLGAGEHKSADHKEIHPLGKVPALVDDGHAVFESAAICMYLGDRFPNAKLAPPPADRSRGEYYQWSVFSVASLEAAVFKVASTREDGEKYAKALAQLAPMVAALEATLTGRDFLLEMGFTAADVLNASIIGWALDLGAVEPDSSVAAWIARTRGRPAYERMTERASA